MIGNVVFAGGRRLSHLVYGRPRVLRIPAPIRVSALNWSLIVAKLVSPA